MKRSLAARAIYLGLSLFSAALVAGCPIYSDNAPAVECIYATDCPFGYRCANSGICVQSPPHGGPVGDAGPRDAADAADAGDSAETGGGDAAGDASPTDGATSDARNDAPSADAGAVVYCGNPSDCTAEETCGTDGVCHRGNCTSIPCINQYQCAVTSSGPACVRGNAKGCSADRHCLGSERCIDGACVLVTELCTDRAQCGAGKACADGRCVTTCTADGQCAPGFLCRTALGVCTAKAEPCTHTRDCASRDEVCVDGACVPRCNASGACGAGNGVCVDNGCVPSAKIPAECDGQGTPTGCPAGSICLHRHCYVSCAADAGGCNPQSTAPVCKTVSLGMSSYAVCGTADTLGSECDLTAGRPCTDGETCIDGFCR